MAKRLEPKAAAKLRADARAAERNADTDGAYPARTRVRRPNAPSRIFNIRLSEEQYAALEEGATAEHLPLSTMARAWPLDRLDRERHAS
ncbi:MAG: hypothetical protein ACYDAQ_06070 [Mycobacteriales bacterium]